MRTTDRNGREDALMWKTLQLPPCGCTIAGAGTLPDPVRIIFCKAHTSDALKNLTDVVEGVFKKLPLIEFNDGDRFGDDFYFCSWCPGRSETHKPDCLGVKLAEAYAEARKVLSKEG